MSIGVSYLPPLYPLTIYSPANFTYQSESVSLATTDKRYLLKVGQDTDNAITTFNGDSTFNGASTFNNGLVVNNGTVNIGGQTGRIKIGYYSTGLISIGDGVGATANLQIGNPSFGRIAFINNPIYPIAFWSPTVCKASLTCESGFAVNSLGGAGQTFEVGAIGRDSTPSNFHGLVTCVQGLTVNNTVTTLNLGLTVNNGLTTINNGLTTSTNITLPITRIVPTVNQLGFQIIGNTLPTIIALTSGSVFNASSISLPAYGTWLINCYFVLNPSATTTVTNYTGGLSTVGATAGPTSGNYVANYASQTLPTNNYLVFDTTLILTPSIATTCWLNLMASFTTTGALNIYFGTSIKAVRIA